MERVRGMTGQWRCGQEEQRTREEGTQKGDDWLQILRVDKQFEIGHWIPRDEGKGGIGREERGPILLQESRKNTPGVPIKTDRRKLAQMVQEEVKPEHVTVDREPILKRYVSWPLSCKQEGASNESMSMWPADIAQML